MATVPKINLKIPQGTTYTHEFNYVESDGTTIIDLTSYIARLQMRDEVDSVGFFHEATTENSGLTINASLGRITLAISSTDTAAFSIYKGFYDLELIAPNAAVTRIVQGKVTIDPEVTR